ncbi:hypothetical protein INR49_006135 [Caranx melampygus]|nr:hypothetical protein INR49_006135 [Caranx melampygus]
MKFAEAHSGAPVGCMFPPTHPPTPLPQLDHVTLRTQRVTSSSLLLMQGGTRVTGGHGAESADEAERYCAAPRLRDLQMSTTTENGMGGPRNTSREKTYKKTTSSALKGSIQLGIGYTVGNLTSKPDRDVLMQDFYVVESYSLVNEPLIELANPGASGSLFYLTSDDEFIIKTVQHKEAKFLQRLLPGYYMNLNQNPRTLLPKFYGLYCIQSGGINIRLVVMNNVLPRSVKMHYKYDLKGSTYKRRASRKEREKVVRHTKTWTFRTCMRKGFTLTQRRTTT